jgi:hypothetical protein
MISSEVVGTNQAKYKTTILPIGPIKDYQITNWPHQ